MKLSIVIPTLNEEKYIYQTLESIRLQGQLGDTEVIVVDGNSSDNTIKEVTSFQTSLDLQVLELQEANTSLQRNEGADKARGDYIIFLDADTLLSNNFLSTLREIVTSNDYDIIIPNYKTTDSNVLYKSPYFMANKLIWLSSKLNRRIGLGITIITKNSLFRDNAGFDETIRVGEDLHFVDSATRFNEAQYKQERSLTVYSSSRRIRNMGIIQTYKFYLSYFIRFLLRRSTGKDTYTFYNKNIR
jgi:glycosyltransferase involved in cell wall biosynthesis